MKLVQWSSGKYGVVKGCLWFKQAVDSSGYWWITRELWSKYCEFDTEKGALNAAGKLPYKIIKRV